jgi:hypothetical protein
MMRMSVSRAVKSAGLVVYSGKPSAIAVAAIIRCYLVLPTPDKLPRLADNDPAPTIGLVCRERTSGMFPQLKAYICGCSRGPPCKRELLTSRGGSAATPGVSYLNS